MEILVCLSKSTVDLYLGSRECAVSQELRIAVGVFCEGEEVVDVADFAEVMGRWGQWGQMGYWEADGLLGGRWGRGIAAGKYTSKLSLAWVYESRS